MTVQMFDLFLTNEQDVAKPKFIMRASLPIIGRYLRLHRDTERRCKLETGPFTLLYCDYNRSGAGEPGTYIVQRAFADMGIER